MRLHRAAILTGVALLALFAAGLVRAPAAAAAPLPWCGSGEPATDLPDAVSAFEWHVVYAIPNDGSDRFGYWAPRIAGDVAAMSDWWVGQDSTRKPRFDLLQAGGCSSDYARVDISVAHLPHPNGAESASADPGRPRRGRVRQPRQGVPRLLRGLDPRPERLQHLWTGRHRRRVVGVQHRLRRRVRPDRERRLPRRGCDPRARPRARRGAVRRAALLPGRTRLRQLRRPDEAGRRRRRLAREPAARRRPRRLLRPPGSWWDTQDSGLLYKLDKTLPPAPAVVATATSSGTHVDASWVTSPRYDGLNFRIYDENGQLDDDTTDTSLTTSAPVGQTLSWVFRAYDDGGFLGPPATLRFKVGYGIVDVNGTLLKDTVPPGAVKHLRAIRAGSNVLFRWDAVADPLGLRGYRISAAGREAAAGEGHERGRRPRRRSRQEGRGRRRRQGRKRRRRRNGARLPLSPRAAPCGPAPTLTSCRKCWTSPTRSPPSSPGSATASSSRSATGSAAA